MINLIIAGYIQKIAEVSQFIFKCAVFSSSGSCFGRMCFITTRPKSENLKGVICYRPRKMCELSQIVLFRPSYFW
jgi:hypothetical protein